MNHEGSRTSLKNIFTDGSLAEIFVVSSLARLVDVLFDMLRVRKLFHWRMWFLMSHLSSCWREVLIALFEKHIGKSLRSIKYVLVQVDTRILKREENMKKQCCILLWSPAKHVLSCPSCGQLQYFICTNLTSSSYTQHLRMQYLRLTQGEKKWTLYLHHWIAPCVKSLPMALYSQVYLIYLFSQSHKTKELFCK